MTFIYFHKVMCIHKSVRQSAGLGTLLGFRGKQNKTKGLSSNNPGLDWQTSRPVFCSVMSICFSITSVITMSESINQAILNTGKRPLGDVAVSPWSDCHGAVRQFISESWALRLFLPYWQSEKLDFRSVKGVTTSKKYNPVFDPLL